MHDVADNKFHTEALQALLNNKFGFIILDRRECLLGILHGNTRKVLHKLTVDIPENESPGQDPDPTRFGNLHNESVQKRRNCIQKVDELAVQMFIESVQFDGVILASTLDFRFSLLKPDLFFDQKLQAKIVKVVDISYGGENGFNQAIELSTDALQNVKFIQEKKLIGTFFEQIHQDTGKFVFGVTETIEALETGAVETLICWENLEVFMLRLKRSSGEEEVINLRPDQLNDKELKRDPDTGNEMEIIESQDLLKWLANNYKSFGAILEIVTDESQEGAQFVKDFDGIGGILRMDVKEVCDEESIKLVEHWSIAPFGDMMEQNL